NYGSENMSLINELHDTVVQNFAAGPNPSGLAYDSGTGEIFVTNSGYNYVDVVAQGTTTVSATIFLSTSPHGVAYDSGNGDVYLANYNVPGTESVISGVTQTITATVDVGSYPLAAVYDGRNGLDYVSNSESNNVSVINATTNTIVTS